MLRLRIQPPRSRLQCPQQCRAASGGDASALVAAGDEAGPLRCSHCGVDKAGPSPTYRWRKNILECTKVLCKQCW